MIAFLRGKLAYKGLQDIIIDVNGVGYKVLLTRTHIDSLPDLNSEIQIYTYLLHKEDNMQLFGFSSTLERELFTLLISVSGIGSRTALALLSSLSVSDIVSAVISNSPKKLAQAQGIGKKTAERIALELKEKLTEWKYLVVSEEKGRIEETVWEEAKIVLKTLGYTETEIENVLQEINSFCKSETKEEEIIKMALERLSNV